MHFYTANILLLCWLGPISAFALKPRQNPCTTLPPRQQLATYDDLPVLPIDDGNTGLTTFSPYQGLNYTRFSVIPARSGGNGLFYSLSQLSAGPLAQVQIALASLLGPLGGLPALLQQPTIISATPSATFHLDSFQFACSIRAGSVDAVAIIRFSCTVTVRPIDPQRSLESFTCSFTSPPIGSPLVLTTCNVNLADSAGFKFETAGNVSAGELMQLSALLDPTVENILITAWDNARYTFFCPS